MKKLLFLLTLSLPIIAFAQTESDSFAIKTERVPGTVPYLSIVKNGDVIATQHGDTLTIYNIGHVVAYRFVDFPGGSHFYSNSIRKNNVWEDTYTRQNDVMRELHQLDSLYHEGLKKINHDKHIPRPLRKY